MPRRLILILGSLLAAAPQLAMASDFEGATVPETNLFFSGYQVSAGVPCQLLAFGTPTLGTCGWTFAGWTDSGGGWLPQADSTGGSVALGFNTIPTRDGGPGDLDSHGALWAWRGPTGNSAVGYDVAHISAPQNQIDPRCPGVTIVLGQISGTLVPSGYGALLACMDRTQSRATIWGAIRVDARIDTSARQIAPGSYATPWIDLPPTPTDDFWQLDRSAFPTGSTICYGSEFSTDGGATFTGAPSSCVVVGPIYMKDGITPSFGGFGGSSDSSATMSRLVITTASDTANLPLSVGAHFDYCTDPAPCTFISST